MAFKKFFDFFAFGKDKKMGHFYDMITVLTPLRRLTLVFSRNLALS